MLAVFRVYQVMMDGPRVYSNLNNLKRGIEIANNLIGLGGQTSFKYYNKVKNVCQTTFLKSLLAF